MKTYVLAIGGTGARILRSLTMLMAAGAGVNTKKGNDGDKVNEIVPVIIDYDIANGDTNRTQALLENYKYIHDAAYSRKNSEEDIRNFFFGTKVGRIGNKNHKTRFEVFLDPVDSDMTFAQQIGYSTINAMNGLEPTRYLLQSLYDTSDAESNMAELNLNLKVGFKGCPNIGCIVMRDLKNSDEIEQLLNLANGNRVIILGSVFGGTGASGIPELLNIIKDSANGRNIITGIVAMEPYFEVKKDPKSAISSNTFLAKTKAAFDAYMQGERDSVNNKADAIYYVGDNLAARAFDNSEGGTTQQNDAHIAELAAAICVLDFASDAKTFDSEHKFHVVNLEENAGQNKTENEEIVAAPFNYSSFPYDTIAHDYIDPLCRFAILAAYCDTFLKDRRQLSERSIVWAAPTQSNFIDEVDFMNALFAFMDSFKKWIHELENPMHPLRLFNFEQGYEHLFTDLSNQQPGRFFGMSNIIDNKSDSSINSRLNVIYRANQDKEHLKNQNKLMFLKFTSEVTRDLLNKVLEVTAQNRKK